MDVRLPNGTIVRGVPEGTTKEQIQQKAISAGLAAAVDFGAPREPTATNPVIETPQLDALQMARNKIAMPAVPGMQPMLPDMDVSGVNRATAQTRALPEISNSGLLSNENQSKVASIAPVLVATTDPNEIAQIISSTFPNVGVTYNKDAQGGVYPVLVNNETGAVAQVNRPGLSGIDVLQGLGLAAAFTPAGKASTIIGAGLKSGATQAAIEGSQAAAGGDFSLGETALAAATGGAFKGGERALGTAAKLSRAAPENEIVKAGLESGIPVTTTDVFPPKTFPGRALQQTAEKIPLAGTGVMRQEQQAMRQEAVQRVADQYGEFSYEAIVSSLKSTKDKVKQRAGNVIQSAGEKVDQLGEIPLASTKDAIDEAKSILDKPGVLRTGTGLDDLAQLSDALGSAPQTFTSLKENRTAFREIVDSLDPTARSQLTSREKSVLQGVQGAMTKDMEAAARKALTPLEFSKWKKANAIYNEERIKLTRSKIKNILDKGDVTPESVKGMLFSQNPSELKLLYSSLDQNGRKNARSAIVSKIVNDVSKRQTGFTPNSFATELKKYGPQISTFFKGQDKRQIEGLRKALQATWRAQDAATITPTGQSLISLVSIGGVMLDPVASLGTAGTLGRLARLYESAPVRNALLRLNSAKPNSPQFERALNELQGAISTGAQVIRAESQGE